MARKLLFALLFCTPQLGFASVFAANESVPLETVTLHVNECDAPAPDNFQVTGIASDLVSLGWTPAWVGAIHTLEISIEEYGNWIVILTDYNVPGDSYILNELHPGYYKARIATNCSTSETSSIMSEVLFEFKIIDLSTAGRIPKNPVAVEDCENIDYQNHEWVGFGVTEIATGISNLFEINLTPSSWYEHAFVRRVYDNNIVAVNNLGIFPIISNQQIQVDNPFRIDDKSKSEPIIGYVELSRNNTFPNPPIITLCKVINNPTKPWKSDYKFTALVADGIIIGPTPKIGSTDHTVRDTIDYGKFIAQSPFNENLNVFAPKDHYRSNKTIFRLFNANAQIVLFYEVNLSTPQISLPVEMLSSGTYFLRIENETETQTLKVMKLE